MVIFLRQAVFQKKRMSSNDRETKLQINSIL